MSSSIVLAFLLLIAFSSLFAQKKSKTELPPSKEQTLQLRDFSDSLSYALGMNIIQMVKDQQFPLRQDKLLAALHDGFSGKTFALAETDMMSVFQRYQMMKQAEEQAQEAERAKHNRAEGEKFLSANAKRLGVKTTSSGLQYEVLEEGNGPKPSGPEAKVKVHYRGTLIDGKEFDSSYKRGEPIEFELNRVIKGWSEGVQLMNVGSKYKFYIPPDLAYGDREVGGVIPPGSTLIFEVELLEAK